MLLMDSENTPQLWKEEQICTAIEAITAIHNLFITKPDLLEGMDIQEFHVDRSTPLYLKMIDLLCTENKSDQFECLYDYLDDLLVVSYPEGIRKTLIHNDYNPRNVALRKNGEICIYDWELAVFHYPHRDVVEMLSFTLNDGFEATELMNYLRFHYNLAKDAHPDCEWEGWKKGYILALKEYLISRVSFYKTAEILMKLKFVDRIYKNAVRMIQIISAPETASE